MTWVLLAGWVAGWVLLWRLPRPAPTDGATADRVVSVVIPARNEADRLPTLLDGLVRQTRPPDQIVVVDDDSTDGTGDLARAVPGVEVLPAPVVPDGWTGKSWACATGVAASRGDVLVFLDADVTLADDALESLLGSWSRHGGLVSVQPHHHVRRPVEALSLPFNVVSMMGLGVGSLVPPRRQWGAAGPCLVTSRSDYDAVGGHRAVAAAVAEDLALAERFVATGLPVHCLGGGGRIGYRMYRDLRGLVEGWGKNVATGAGRTPMLRALGIALWITALLTALGAVTSGTGGPLVALGLYAGATAQVAAMGRQVGRFGPAALAWPVLVAFFVALFAWSAVRTLVVRRVTWSGRTVELAPRR